MVQLKHDHDTLDKVVTGLRSVGIPDQLIVDSISAMQNQGILFRERVPEDEYGQFDEDTTEAKPISNLVIHALRELKLLGEDDDVILWYCRVVEAYSSFGHSGGSQAATLPVLAKLLNYENLTPLTNDRDEWVEHGPDVFPPNGIWQNVRNSRAFSEDGGKMYYLVDEVTDDGKKTFYTSADKVE